MMNFIISKDVARPPFIPISTMAASCEGCPPVAIGVIPLNRA